MVDGGLKSSSSRHFGPREADGQKIVNCKTSTPGLKQQARPVSRGQSFGLAEGLLVRLVPLLGGLLEGPKHVHYISIGIKYLLLSTVFIFDALFASDHRASRNHPFVIRPILIPLNR